MLNVEAWRAAPHPNTVVVSTIRTALRERGMGVGELQRRLVTVEYSSVAVRSIV